jgi:hypothetical protein
MSEAPTAKMSNEEIAQERRTGRIAGIIGLVGVFMFVIVGVTGIASEFRAADGTADRLAVFPDESSEVLLLLALQATSIVFFIAPLVSLFQSVRNRNEGFRMGLIGLAIAGPLFFAASLVVSYFAIDSAAAVFDPNAVDAGADIDEAAADVVREQDAASVSSGLGFAGQLGLAFIVVYTSLNAMRVGLLTRFWGTLGMALGVGIILLGQPALLAFFLAMSMLVGRLWPGGRPPAWDAGVAMPWPKPGEEQAAEPSEEETAQPEDFEGTATEVSSDERPARRDNKRKRKRKQRS